MRKQLISEFLIHKVKCLIVIKITNFLNKIKSFNKSYIHNF